MQRDSLVGSIMSKPKSQVPLGRFAETAKHDWKLHGVKIVRRQELDSNTPQTFGMTRAAAITQARTGAQKLWAGTMLVGPDARTWAASPWKIGNCALYCSRPRALSLGRAYGVR